MKTLLSFLMTISCAALASAAELYQGMFIFETGGPEDDRRIPVCYSYDEKQISWSATKGSANIPLAKNEIFRVCLVRDKRGKAVTYDSKPAVMIDAAGQLILGENAASAKWMTLSWQQPGEPIETSDYITVGDTLGAPMNESSRDDTESLITYRFDVSTAEDLDMPDGKAYQVYMYLVAMDTRDGEGVCEGQPLRVKSYAMAMCYGTKDQTYVEASNASARSWLVGRETPDDITVYWPGTEIAWQPAAEITSLVVEGETLTGDALAAYLKPNVSEFIADENGLTLTVDAPDVQYYTLYTKAALSDDTWTPFEEFVNKNENFVDKTIGKSYTRFRIGGESVSIPLVEGEVSRFYMLRGE